MSEKIKIGNIGEDAAISFLKSSGYEILETNWRHGHREIDIITLKDSILVIVEVKTRKADSLTAPLEAITHQKQKFLIAAADNYLDKSGLDLEIRFDVISVIHSDEKAIHINHIENAFIPEFE